MKMQNEFKLFDESIYGLLLKNQIINKNNQRKRTYIKNKSINKKKNDKNKRIEGTEKGIRDFNVIKVDKLLKRNINNDIRRTIKIKENNNISNRIYVANNISKYIIINIFFQYILFKYFNMFEFSRAIFLVIILIEYNLYFICIVKFHNIFNINKLFNFEIKANIIVKVKYLFILFILIFYFLYDYGFIIFITHCILKIFNYVEVLPNKKSILQYISLINNKISFVIFIIKYIKSKLVKVKIKEEKRKIRKSSKKILTYLEWIKYLI